MIEKTAGRTTPRGIVPLALPGRGLEQGTKGRLMRRDFMLSSLPVSLLALLICASCTRGPKGLSRATYAATEKAIAAIQRANECRDDGLLIFEPRFLEAEKAVDDARATATNFHDTLVVDHMRGWVESTKLYRRVLDSYESAASDPALKKSAAKYASLLQEVAANSDKRIASMQSYL
jgi:hypothetical protein